MPVAVPTPLAVNCWVCPTATVGLPGATVIVCAATSPAAVSAQASATIVIATDTFALPFIARADVSCGPPAWRRRDGAGPDAGGEGRARPAPERGSCPGWFPEPVHRPTHGSARLRLHPGAHCARAGSSCRARLGQ